ncbi:MAG: hypothetical protein H0X20_04445 [Chloroflexi bacterium]|nr:hypothetical protein [Chloroflexota bacterium]
MTTATPARPMAPRRVTARTLSAALDRATVQAEQAEAMGDAETAKAWRRVLADLQRRIPETDR